MSLHVYCCRGYLLFSSFLLLHCTCRPGVEFSLALSRAAADLGTPKTSDPSQPPPSSHPRVPNLDGYSFLDSPLHFAFPLLSTASPFSDQRIVVQISCRPFHPRIADRLPNDVVLGRPSQPSRKGKVALPVHRLQQQHRQIRHVSSQTICIHRTKRAQDRPEQDWSSASTQSIAAVAVSGRQVQGHLQTQKKLQQLEPRTAQPVQESSTAFR